MHAHLSGELHLLRLSFLHRSGLAVLIWQLRLFALPSIFVLFGRASASYNGFQVEHHSIPLKKIVSGGPPRDGIPAITNPKLVPSQDLNSLSSEDRVLGIQGTHQAKAYPFSTLEKLDQDFPDTFNGENYVVCWDNQGRSAKVLNQQGQPMPSLTAYWFAWFAFHPNTEIFNREIKEAKKELLAPSHGCDQ